MNQQFSTEKCVSLFHTVDSHTITVETMLPVKLSINTVETLAAYDTVTDDST